MIAVEENFAPVPYARKDGCSLLACGREGTRRRAASAARSVDGVHVPRVEGAVLGVVAVHLRQVHVALVLLHLDELALLHGLYQASVDVHGNVRVSNNSPPGATPWRVWEGQAKHHDAQ